jgi:hypothetical protein
MRGKGPNDVPQKAVELTISMAPMAPLVAVSRIPPNPMAGARHAKKRNKVVARLWAFMPSVMSDL